MKMFDVTPLETAINLKGSDFFMQQKRYIRRKDSHVNVKKVNLGLSFEKAYEYYLASKNAENVRELTLITYADSIKMLYKWFESFEYNIQFIDDVTPKMIRQYINYLRFEHLNYKTKEKGVSLNTINAQIRFLKAFFNFMYKEGYADINPTESIEYLKVDEIKRELLTDDEMDRLLNMPNESLYPQFRDKVIMHLAYDSYLRINEMILLDVDDLHLKERKIILPASKEKGRKERVIICCTVCSSYLVKPPAIHGKRGYFNQWKIHNRLRNNRQ